MQELIIVLCEDLLTVGFSVLLVTRFFTLARLRTLLQTTQNLSPTPSSSEIH